MPRSVKRVAAAPTYAAREKPAGKGPASGGRPGVWKTGELPRFQLRLYGDEILIVEPGRRASEPHVLGVLDSRSVQREGKVDRLLRSRREPARPRPTPGAKASEPDARARALLRGRLIAERDLEASGGAVNLEGVRQIMNGVTRQAVTHRVKEGSLLAVPGPSNRRVYPVVQFVDGSPVKGLREVRDALGTTSGVAILNFLVNAEPRLGGRRPIDLLKAGDLDQVLETARRSGIQGA